MNVDPTKIHIETDSEVSDPTRVQIFGYTAHGGHRFRMPFVTEITEGLWQGGVQRGLVLPSFITSVVSLYKWERYEVKHDLNSFIEVEMYDSVDQSFEQIGILADWVNLERSRGGQVLIHCQAGLNRSSLVVATALVRNGDVDTGQEAVDLIRKKRSTACLCNPAFEQHVIRLTP